MTGEDLLQHAAASLSPGCGWSHGDPCSWFDASPGGGCVAGGEAALPAGR